MHKGWSDSRWPRQSIRTQFGIQVGGCSEFYEESALILHTEHIWRDMINNTSVTFPIVIIGKALLE